MLNSLLKNRGTLKIIMKDDEYIDFIKLIYNDMVHDETLETQQPSAMFKEVLKILVKNKPNVPNIDVNIENMTKKQADQNSDTQLKEKLLELKNNTVVIPRILRSIYDPVKHASNPKLNKINVILDSDFRDEIQHHILRNNKGSKFKELLTLGGILDPGQGMCGRSFEHVALRINTQPIITNIYNINTRPLKITIESPSYSTKFEVNYDCKNNIPIQLKVNDTPIQVVTRSNAKQDNNRKKGNKSTNTTKKLKKAIGKMCGDLLQILSVIRNNHTKYKTAFATIDKSAANIFIFLSNIYRKNTLSIMKNKIERNSTYKNLNKSNKNVKNMIENDLNMYDNEYLKPKLIWLQQGGARQDPRLRVLIWLVNLKKYISSVYYEHSNELLRKFSSVSNIKVPNAKNIPNVQTNFRSPSAITQPARRR